MQLSFFSIQSQLVVSMQCLDSIQNVLVLAMLKFCKATDIGLYSLSFFFYICTGGPLIVLKNGSIFFGKPYYENTNKIAVLWEELEILLNKHKPYYREIRTMRGRTMRYDDLDILPSWTLFHKSYSECYGDQTLS